MRFLRFLPVAVLILLPAAAQAYIDPGILSALYQVVYVFVFAVISALILRPWAFLKSQWARLFKKGNNGKPTDHSE